MNLSKGDKVLFKGTEYEIMDFHITTDMYWVKPVGGYAIFTWSYEYVSEELFKGNMKVVGKADIVRNCWHNYEERPLFRFVYKECTKCGKSDGVVNMMEKKKK